jgi:predicted transcriptional regulator
MLVTGSQITEAAQIVAKFDAGDKHNFEVIGRRIQDLPQERQDFWSEMAILTVVKFSGQDRSNALMELLGALVEMVIATQDQN